MCFPFVWVFCVTPDIWSDASEVAQEGGLKRSSSMPAKRRRGDAAVSAGVSLGLIHHCCDVRLGLMIVRACPQVYVCARVPVLCTCVPVCVCVCTCVCVRACVTVCVCVHIRLCVYTCVHTLACSPLSGVGRCEQACALAGVWRCAMCAF